MQVGSVKKIAEALLRLAEEHPDAELATEAMEPLVVVVDGEAVLELDFERGELVE